MASFSIEVQEQIPDQVQATEPALSETFIFRSKLPDIEIPNNQPLHSYCFEKVIEFADRPCLIDGSTNKIYTFAETHLVCRKSAAGLASLGVKKGDVVMVLLQNCPEFAITFMASSMIGAVATTMNPFCNPHEIFKQFKASGTKLVVTQSSFIDKFRTDEFPTIGKGLTIVTVDTPPEGCHAFSVLSGANENEIPDVVIDPNDPVVLPFSSGTTGLSKGVVVTHKSIITSAAQLVNGENPNLYLTSDDVALCVLPLFHIFALHTVLLCSLRTGSGVLLMKKFEIALLLDLIQRHHVSAAYVVPPMVLALTKNPMVEKYDLSSIRIVLSAAAPLGKELEEALQNILPQAVVGQGYGMTEGGPTLSMCPAFAKQPIPSKIGSCGTTVRNAELKIIDPETGLSLRYNQPGEICIRGQQIMKGYLNDPEATARTIDVNGWLHTGDIGYVDDDEEIFVIDRVKELIKFKGFQVPPAELESLLLGHPSVVDAAVVPQKDEVAGEVPVAFVVQSPIKGLDLTEEVVKEYIAKQVVFYKKLHKVYFISAIPKSSAGKILRKDLRAKLGAQ